MATVASDLEAQEVVQDETEDLVRETQSGKQPVISRPAPQAKASSSATVPQTESILQKVKTNLSIKPGAPGTTGTGGRPYSSFSEGRKWFIVTLSAVAGTFS